MERFSYQLRPVEHREVSCQLKPVEYGLGFHASWDLSSMALFHASKGSLRMK
jgi:hypothetical protein